MEKRQRVIVYGDSLVLAGVQTSLGLDPSFEVITHALPITEQDLLALHPSAVIFDIAAVQPKFHCALAQELPGLLLIGIDPEHSQAILWSGQQLCELSTQDLIQVISPKDSGSKLL